MGKKNVLERFSKIFGYAGDDYFINSIKELFKKEKILSYQMKLHAKDIVYNFLKKNLVKVAREEEGHAELLKRKIEEAGSPVPNFKIPRINRQKRLSDKLSADLLMEEEIYENYRSLLNRTEDAHLREVLEGIIEEEIRHQVELKDIILRLN